MAVEGDRVRGDRLTDQVDVPIPLGRAAAARVRIRTAVIGAPLPGTDGVELDKERVAQAIATERVLVTPGSDGIGGVGIAYEVGIAERVHGAGESIVRIRAAVIGAPQAEAVGGELRQEGIRVAADRRLVTAQGGDGRSTRGARAAPDVHVVVPVHGDPRDLIIARTPVISPPTQEPICRELREEAITPRVALARGAATEGALVNEFAQRDPLIRHREAGQVDVAASIHGAGPCTVFGRASVVRRPGACSIVRVELHQQPVLIATKCRLVDIACGDAARGIGITGRIDAVAAHHTAREGIAERTAVVCAPLTDTAGVELHEHRIIIADPCGLLCADRRDRVRRARPSGQVDVTVRVQIHGLAGIEVGAAVIRAPQTWRVDEELY